MSVPNREIVKACMPLLEGVGRHAHGGGEQRFLTAYQIWTLLEEEGNSICEALRSEYGTAVGKGGGENVGPAQRIAQALGQSDRIETHYLDTRRIGVAGKQPSGADCGIFRERE